MAIEIICDDCGNKYRVGDDKAGTRVKCKECGAKIEVPDDDFETETEARPRPNSKKKRRDSEGAPAGLIIGIGAVAAVAVIGLVLYFVLGGKKNDALAQAAPANALPNSNPNGLPSAPPSSNMPASTMPASSVPASTLPTSMPASTLPNSLPGGANVNAGTPVNTLPGSGLPMSTPVPAAQGLPGFPAVPPNFPFPGPAGRNGGSGAPAKGFGGFAGGNDPSVDAPAPDNWSVKVDPTKIDFKVAADKTINLKIPKGGDFKDVVYPETPSPFAAIGNNDNAQSVREIWNLATKQKAGSITGITVDTWGGISALSPDGQYFASSLGGQKKNSIGVYPAKGKALGELESGGDNSGVSAVFFANPERLVALNSNGSARVWKIPSGEVEHELQLNDAKQAYHVAISPGGNYLAATTGKNTLQVFDLNTAEVVGELAIPTENQFGSVQSDAISFSPDGQELALVTDAHGDKKLFVRYNVADGKMLAKANLNFASQRPLADRVKTHRLSWFPDRSKLLYRGHHVLDATVGGPVWNAPEEDGSSEAPRKLLDGKRILIAYGGRQNPGLKVAPVPLDSIDAAAKVVASGGEASDAGMPTLSKADYDGMMAIAPIAANWSMQPDPSPASNSVKNSITLPKERPNVGGLVIARPSVNRAIIWYTDDSLSTMQGKGLMRFGVRVPDSQKGMSLVEAYDLAKGGKAVATLPLTYQSVVLDASLDGEHIAVRTTKPDDQRVDVYNVMTGKHVAGLRPFQQKDDFFKGVTAAVIVDGQHLLTQNFNGSSTYMWKLPECKAIWQMKGAKNFCLSPGGKYMGFLSESRYLFMDPRTGELVGELPVSMPNMACAFHPMGTHIAILASDTISRKITIVDVATGKATADFFVPQGNDTIQWCGDGHVLVDNSWLVDLKQQKNGWRYITEFAAHARTQPDGRHWYVGGVGPQDPNITLSCATIPEKMVADKINAAQLPDESLMKPGMELMLSVNLTAAMPPDRPNLGQEVGKWFEAGLRKNGFQVGATGNYTLAITSSQSNTGKNMEFRSIGFGRGGPGGNTTVPVIEVKCEVALITNGQAAWKHTESFTNASFGIVHLGQNEDITSHLAKQMWSHLSDRLTKFPVPSQVFGTNAGAGLGQSKFTIGGVQPLSGR